MFNSSENRLETPLFFQEEPSLDVKSLGTWSLWRKGWFPFQRLSCRRCVTTIKLSIWAVSDCGVLCRFAMHSWQSCTKLCRFQQLLTKPEERLDLCSPPAQGTGPEHQSESLSLLGSVIHSQPEPTHQVVSAQRHHSCLSLTDPSPVTPVELELKILCSQCCVLTQLQQPLGAVWSSCAERGWSGV